MFDTNSRYQIPSSQHRDKDNKILLRNLKTEVDFKLSQVQGKLC